MQIEGGCGFCKVKGNWEAGLFHSKRRAKDRPQGWAAMFPWNRRELPIGVNFSPESLQEHRVTTRLACPDCWR